MISVWNTSISSWYLLSYNNLGLTTIFIYSLYKEISKKHFTQLSNTRHLLVHVTGVEKICHLPGNSWDLLHTINVHMYGKITAVWNQKKSGHTLFESDIISKQPSLIEFQDILGLAIIGTHLQGALQSCKIQKQKLLRIW